MAIEIPQNVVDISSEIEKRVKKVIESLSSPTCECTLVGGEYDVQEAVGEMFAKAGYFCYWGHAPNGRRTSVIISKRKTSNQDRIY